MIDTIVLTLSEDMFVITEHSKFSPSTIGFFKAPYYTLGGRGSMSCYQNPTSSDLRNGIIKPRLTVTRRITKGGFQIILKIEVSVPKLIFGNNFDELTEAHFHEVIKTLKLRLKEMGVWVRNLEVAPVSAIHFGKNIVLCDYSTPQSILHELSKANHTMRVDTNQTDYRNEGHSFKLHTNTFEVAIYDKLRDLRQAKMSEKRAIEKDNAIQLNLFDDKKITQPFEVLRLEVRLNTKAKIRKTLAECSVNSEPIFHSVYRATVAKQVINKAWSDIESSYKLLGYKPADTRELLTRLLALNPQLTTKKAMQFIGFKLTIEEIGIRDFRIATERGSKRKANAWYKFQAEANALILPQPNYSPLRPIRNAINRFEAVRLKDYEDKVYNVT